MRLRQAIEDVLSGGLDEEEDLLSTLARLAMERLLQEALEQEVTDYLGREHYQRRAPDAPHRGYRNGYEPSTLRTTEGEVRVQAPQVRKARETYRSRLLEHVEGRNEVLERLAVAMYARGLDATYLNVRQNHHIVSMAAVVAIGVRETGEREVLGFAVGASEEASFWLEFLRNLIRRGLRGVRLVVSDAHEGLKAALGQVLSGAAWQRRRVHFMRNVLAHVTRADKTVVSEVGVVLDG